jgi:AAA family ATP:ADP antiporter
MLLFTIGSTFLYFQQADIVGKTIADRATRTAFLARIDLYVNLLTVIVQLFLSGRLLKLLGVTLTLIFLPLISILGFATLGLFPLLPVVVVFQVVRRAGNFAIANPAREVLFTVISREDKYKAKNLIDTFIYRAGDQVGAWTYTLFGFLKLSISGIAFAAVPVAAIWLFVSLWLGRKQKRLVQAQSWSC